VSFWFARRAGPLTVVLASFPPGAAFGGTFEGGAALLLSCVLCPIPVAHCRSARLTCDVCLDTSCSPSPRPSRSDASICGMWLELLVRVSRTLRQGVLSDSFCMIRHGALTMNEEIASPFGEHVCDFCLMPKPCWAYDAKDVSAAADVLNVQPRVDVIYCPSTSAWAACDRCAKIIDRRDVLALATVCTVSARDRFLSVNIPFTDDLDVEVTRLFKMYSELLPSLKPRRHATPKERSSKCPVATIMPCQHQTPESN